MASTNKTPEIYTLVTGAAGFIAFHLVERLLRNGIPVVGVDSMDPYYPTTLKHQNLIDLKRIAGESKTDFVFRESHIADLTADCLAQYEINRVIHLAAKAGVRSSQEFPIDYVSTNVTETTHLLELSRQLEVRTFVFGSSSSVYGRTAPSPFQETDRADEPISVYGASKRAAELLISTYAYLYGIRAASLRFFSVYGPRQRPDLAIRKFVTAALEGETITLFADASGGRDYTFVTDIVEGILRATNWCDQAPPFTHEIFNLGSGRSITPNELILLIEQATGRPLKFARSSIIAGDMGSTLADLTKSKNVLGYSPKVPFNEGIQVFVNWMLDQRKVKKNRAA